MPFRVSKMESQFYKLKNRLLWSIRAATFPYSKCPENGFPQTDPYYCEVGRAFLRARGRCETSRGELYRGLALMRNAKPLADLSRAHVARGLVLYVLSYCTYFSYSFHPHQSSFFPLQIVILGQQKKSRKARSCCSKRFVKLVLLIIECAFIFSIFPPYLTWYFLHLLI